MWAGFLPRPVFRAREGLSPASLALELWASGRYRDKTSLSLPGSFLLASLVPRQEHSDATKTRFLRPTIRYWVSCGIEISKTTS